MGSQQPQWIDVSVCRTILHIMITSEILGVLWFMLLILYTKYEKYANQQL